MTGFAFGAPARAPIKVGIEKRVARTALIPPKPNNTILKDLNGASASALSDASSYTIALYNMTVISIQNKRTMVELTGIALRVELTRTFEGGLNCSKAGFLLLVDLH